MFSRNLEIRLSLNTTIFNAGGGIAPILPMLMQLERISVTSDFDGCSPIDIERLPAEFFYAFKNRLLSSRSVLKEVAIFPISNFPLRIFDDCTTVKSVLLCGFSDYTNLVVPSHPQGLDSLALHNWRVMDPLFLVWAREHIHSLRSLSLHLGNQDLVNKLLPELFGMCSRSLTNLGLHIFSGFRVDADGRIVSPERKTCGIDLSSLLLLKHLTIRANLFITDVRHLSCFPAMIPVLKTTPYLDSLTLKFYICSRGKLEEFKMVDWSPLLSFFSSSSSRFRHIGLRLSLHCYTYVDASADTLPQLYGSEIIVDMMAKGILDISSEKYSVYCFE